MTAHTPGPWTQENKGELGTRTARHVVVDAKGRKIVKMPDLSSRSYANAARIVTCVNSCEGINPEAVPEMLVGLKQMENIFYPFQAGYRGESQAAIRAVHDAIAKAEGRKS